MMNRGADVTTAMSDGRAGLSVAEQGGHVGVGNTPMAAGVAVGDDGGCTSG